MNTDIATCSQKLPLNILLHKTNRNLAKIIVIKNIIVAARLLPLLIAKRSVVSAANYAERSSFAKDQIFVLLPIEVISHANEVFCFFAYNLLCQHFVSILLRGSHYGVVFIHGFYTIFIKSIVFHHNLLSFGDRILLGEL